MHPQSKLSILFQRLALYKTSQHRKYREKIEEEGAIVPEKEIIKKIMETLNLKIIA